MHSKKFWVRGKLPKWRPCFKFGWFWSLEDPTGVSWGGWWTEGTVGWARLWFSFYYKYGIKRGITNHYRPRSPQPGWPDRLNLFFLGKLDTVLSLTLSHRWSSRKPPALIIWARRYRAHSEGMALFIFSTILEPDTTQKKESYLNSYEVVVEGEEADSSIRNII